MHWSKLLMSGGVVCAMLLGGCATNRPDEVPATATMVVEGTSRVTYTAPNEGMVYIYDDTHNRVVYSGNIERSQTISVDPQNDKIMLGTTVASEQDLIKGNRFQVYYLPEQNVSRRVTIEQREDRRDRW